MNDSSNCKNCLNSISNLKTGKVSFLVLMHKIGRKIDRLCFVQNEIRHFFAPLVLQLLCEHFT
jgi:hypothetical protein